MRDLIDRQVAIDAFLTELTKRERKNLLHTWSTAEVKYFITDMLERLPSAQQGRYKWNPIKDGLPDEEGAYFVTDDAGGMAAVYLDVFSHYEDGSPYWLYSQNVTAWMHTPDPYHGGDEE